MTDKEQQLKHFREAVERKAGDGRGGVALPTPSTPVRAPGEEGARAVRATRPRRAGRAGKDHDDRRQVEPVS